MSGKKADESGIGENQLVEALKGFFSTVMLARNLTVASYGTMFQTMLIGEMLPLIRSTPAREQLLVYAQNLIGQPTVPNRQPTTENQPSRTDMDKRRALLTSFLGRLRTAHPALNTTLTHQVVWAAAVTVVDPATPFDKNIFGDAKLAADVTDEMHRFQAEHNLQATTSRG